MNFLDKKKKKRMYSKLKTIDLLPIGSVVTLRNNNKKYMIMDYSGSFLPSKYDENLCVEAHYMVIEYPVGYVADALEPIPVMQEDIDVVIFKGYDSIERKQFCEEIDRFYEVRNG